MAERLQIAAEPARIALFSLLFSLAGPTPVTHAQQAAAASGPQRVRARLQVLDYAGAIATAEAQLRRGGNEGAALATLYELLGFALAAVDRVDEARRYWWRLLALRPDYRLDESVSPKIRRPLSEALADWAGRPGLTVAHWPPPSPRRGHPLTLAVKVIEDPASMVRLVRLVYRTPGAVRPRRLTGGERRGGEIVVTLPLPALGSGVESLSYHLELLDAQRNIVARLRTARRPFRVALATSDSSAPDEAASPPWYRRWWVWTLAGVVVAGATTAAVVAATAAPDESRVRVGYSVGGAR